jgi:Cu+-exporting ATPase
LPAVEGFGERTGAGVVGQVAGRQVLVGSASWLAEHGVPGVPGAGPGVQVAIGGRHRGSFEVASQVRPEIGDLLGRLARRYQLALLSGDSERERGRFLGLFPAGARLEFDQSPLNKLDFVRVLQQSGRTVMMVGDGLNDAGALKQSDVGVAVVERVGRFSPASDIILEAGRVRELPEVLRFSGRTVKVVRLSFLLSSLYNVVGMSIAAAGLLSPLVCAILMPLSSVTVVAFACGATRWAASRAGLRPVVPAAATP